MARGLSSYIAAGAVQGFGTGLVERTRSMREEGRQRLRMEFQRGERIAGQEFSAEQNRLSREATAANAEATRGLQREMQTQRLDATSTENAKGRTHDSRMQGARLGAQSQMQTQRLDAQRTENQANRDQQTGNLPVDRFTGEDGYLYGVTRSGKAIQVTDEQGNPVRPAKKKTDKPTMTASQIRAALSQALRAATKKDYTNGKVVDWQVYLDELELAGVSISEPAVMNRVRNGLRKDAEKQARREAQDRKSAWKAESSEFDGMTRDAWETKRTEDIIAEGMADLGLSEEAPQRAPKYQVGQTATNPTTGEKLRFNGRSWEPVE